MSERSYNGATSRSPSFLNAAMEFVFPSDVIDTKPTRFQTTQVALAVGTMIYCLYSFWIYTFRTMRQDRKGDVMHKCVLRFF